MSRSNPSVKGQKEEQWDFLKGSGPSSALYYYAPLQREGAFKPGWKTKRPQAAILQDSQRKGDEALKVCDSNTGCLPMAKKHLNSVCNNMTQEQQAMRFGEIRKERILDA